MENVNIQGRNYTQDFYVYDATHASLASGASVTINVQLEADSDFQWLKTSFFATNSIVGATAKNAQIDPIIKVQIQDSGSGRNLFSKPVHVGNIAGNGALPFVLPVPRLFKANSNIAVTLTNASSGTTYVDLDFSMIGRKLFSRG